MIDTLLELINCLFPDPPPGILVLRNGNPPIPPTRTRQIVIAIARATRINRDNGLELLGLYEFHLGIIYMHWGNFCKARRQFVLALRHWRYLDSSDSNNTTIPQAVCLTYFAKGYAQEQEFSYEEALSTYRVAGKRLHDITESNIRESDCIFPLQAILNEREAYLHKQLFSPPTNSPPSGSHAHQTDDDTTAPPRDNNPPVDDTRPPDSQQTDVPAPLFRVDKRPSSSPLSPIPDHTNNGSCKWYSVHSIKHDSFLDIKADTYLLIDTKRANKYDEDAWLLVKNEQGGGSISLRPYPPKAPFERIFLTEVIQIGTFERGVFNGKVKFSPNRERNDIKQLDIIGIVIGIWQAQKHATP